MNAGAADWISLQNDQLTAAIDPQGAQLSVLRDARGRDLLWHGDAAIWKGRAPILFPIVGALNGGHYRWRGARHALPRHGFARERRFEPMHHTAVEALFRLVDDTTTRHAYPFAFELDVAFHIDGARLAIRATARNTGASPMPASLGFHPALRWPLPDAGERNAHYLEFGQEEPAPIRRLDAQGLLGAAAHPTPIRGRRLALDDALFTDDVLILDHFTSRSLAYGGSTGPRIQVDFPDATHLGLWTKPGAGFLCIEPWRGIADPAGFDGEFDTKPGVFTVAPGASESLTMELTLLHAA
jgi:galactose mutarotase-like enzyme